MKFDSFVLIFLGSEYLRMKKSFVPSDFYKPEIYSLSQDLFEIVSTAWCCLSWCFTCMCQAGEVSDTDSYFHIQLN